MSVLKLAEMEGLQDTTNVMTGTTSMAMDVRVFAESKKGGDVMEGIMKLLTPVLQIAETEEYKDLKFAMMRMQKQMTDVMQIAQKQNLDGPAVENLHSVIDFQSLSSIKQQSTQEESKVLLDQNLMRQ